MTEVYFKAGSYHAAIDLENLPGIPARNIEKLFRLMLSEPWANQQAIDITEAFITTSMTISDSGLQEAAEAHTLGWTDVPNKRSRRPEVVDALAQNKRLTEALKKAKTQYQQWETIQKLWNNCKGD